MLAQLLFLRIWSIIEKIVSSTLSLAIVIKGICLFE